MPLRLWQEVQILPWSTEIVALTCGTRKRLRPVVPAQARQACCATPVQNQKVGQLPPSLNFNFLTLRGEWIPGKDWRRGLAAYREKVAST
jgi:hypothetical protein